MAWAAVAVAAAALWLVSWSLLHQSFWGRYQLIDTPIYEQYGDAMRAGELPYRDFALEYPPGALPVFLAPEVTASPRDFGAYGHSFEKWMAGCGVAMVLLCTVALAALRVSPARAMPPLALVSVSPLLLGNVFLSRFDLWPATLTVGTLAALLAGLDLVGAAVLALAIAAKLYPAVLVPLGIAWVWRRRGRRRALEWTALLVGLLAAVFLPFVVLSPGGVGHSLGTQLERPLQIESLGSALLIWAHHVFGLTLTVRSDHGSQNLEGTLARAVGILSTVIAAAGLVAVWTLFARGPARRERLVCAAAAAVAVFIAFGKVFSPQFMIWLVPLVPLVRGRRGAAAAALLALALALTQVWFPDRYWSLPLELDRGVAAAVLARDLTVVALAGLLLAGLREPRRQASSPT